MNKLYKNIGISKQAVYQYADRQRVFDQKISQLVIEADLLKEDHPGCGVEKMYHTLKPDFIGRDRFIELFMELGYRVKRQKNYKRTTVTGPIYYPNLIKGRAVGKPSTVWQSDITYYYVGGEYCYAVFIKDVYTKKIVGYCVSDNMRATANLKALKMALASYKPPGIHHSDRGSQYSSKAYTDLLKDHGIEISMCLSAQDNAYAERINRTIKEEFLDHWKPKNLKDLKKHTARAVAYYNNKRPHNSLNKMSPNEFENYWSFISRNKRPIITIFNNEILT